MFKKPGKMPRSPKAASGRKTLGKNLGQKNPGSSLEQSFLRHWRLVRSDQQYAALASVVPDPASQYRFHPVRRWAFDFAWPDAKVAVELDGGQWSHGRHSRGLGMASDREKDREAQLSGWIVLRYVTSDLDSRPVQVIEQVMRAVQARLPA